MTTAAFIVCFLCLGWTIRLLHLLESELRLQAQAKVPASMPAKLPATAGAQTPY
ncbi:MAG: hypothetical protein ACWA5A_06840 [Marinibacterium sp.]